MESIAVSSCLRPVDTFKVVVALFRASSCDWVADSDDLAQFND